MKLWSTLPETKKALIVIGVLLLVMGVLVYKNLGNQPPYTVTNERFETLKEAMHLYIKEEGKLPESLEQLKVADETLIDQFGTPFVLQVDGSSATIVSYGQDKKSGGHFFNRDHRVTVRLDP